MSDLERRLRRIVFLVVLLGIAGAIVGMFPVHDLEHDAMQTAYGVPLWLMVGAIALFGGLLVANPRRAIAIGWMVWTALSMLTFFGMTWGDHLFTPADVWPLPIIHALIGGMFVLVFPVTAIVLVASDREPREAAASARVVSR